ncbi:MAG: MAC/perforin domain-containing protein [Saprospiraceae bacterium]
MKNLFFAAFYVLLFFGSAIIHSQSTQTYSDTGTVTLISVGDNYNLLVFEGEAGEPSQAIGKLLKKGKLELPNMKRGTYLDFKAYDTNDNVRTEPIYLWNVDNQNYFVYAQSTTHALEDAQALGINIYGINLVTLNPRDIASGKQKGQIFQKMESASVDFTSVEGAAGNYIKEGFDYNPLEKGLGSSGQKMRYKSESVKDAWSVNVDLSGSVPVKGARVDAGVGIGYNEFDETFKNQKEVFLERSEWKSKYSIECNPARADLDEMFKASVLKLPADYNVNTKNEYRDFIDTYGTHFLSKVVYGGFYTAFIGMSESTFNSLKGNSLNIKTDLAISAGGNKEITEKTNPALGAVTGKVEKAVKTNSDNSKGGKLSVSYNKEHEEQLEEYFQDMEAGYEYAGGDGNFDNWQLNKDDAVPVIIEPQLISELIKPEVFKDDTEPGRLRTIKENVERYLVEYIGGMPKKHSLQPPPVAYNLEIKEVSIVNYRDDGDATQKADMSIVAYSGELSRLSEKNPQLNYRQGDVDKQVVREANFNPSQNLGSPLSLISPKIGLVVKNGNPDKRVFKIVGNFKEYDSNFGGSPEEWMAYGYINTDLSNSNPTRNGELRLNHSGARWGSKQQFDVVIKYTLTRENNLFDIPEGLDVVETNKSDQILTSELVTDPGVGEPKKITLRHLGAYIARYSIEYLTNGRAETVNTGDVSSGFENSYYIPADATNVKIKAEGLTGLVWEPVTLHFQQVYPQAVSRIIESYGTTLSQSYKELNENGGLVSQGSSPPPPADNERITFRNKGGFVARYTLEYTLQGRQVKEESGDITAGREKFYDIPRVATNVKVKAEGATGLVWEPWRVHYEHTFPRPETKIVESHGTTLGQSSKVY